MKQRLQQGLLADVLRRASLSGVGEIRLPAELRRALVSNIEKLRENAVDIFAKEISRVVSKIDAKHMVDDVLQNYTLRLEARIDLVPKARGAETAQKGKQKGKKK